MNKTVRLMAWVGENDTYGKWQSYQAEILSADGTMRDAIVLPINATSPHYVPFSALQSVALYEGDRVLQAFGRPPFATDAPAPAWVDYAEVAYV